MPFLELGLGLVLLVGGGEALVRGAVAVAQRFGLSALLIGLTLAAYGTSAPELVVCVDAALRDSPGIALGNLLGSNVANALLILAVAALIRPVGAHLPALRRDGSAMLLATLLFIGLLLLGTITAWQGAVLVALLAAFIVHAYRDERGRADPDDDAPSVRPLVTGGLVVGGLAALAFGADLFVSGAVTIARAAGVSETLIGLTLVAIGTSLPELFATGIAAIKGRSDIALGNVIGSNLFNVLGILGITALVAPLAVPVDITWLDLTALLGSAVLLVVFAATGAVLNRIEAGVLLLGYAVYIGLKAGPFGL